MSVVGCPNRVQIRVGKYAGFVTLGFESLYVGGIHFDFRF